jgi:hypothetical protein
MNIIKKVVNKYKELTAPDRAYKTGLAGRGPWIIYRCQKCWGAFIEIDIIGDGRGHGGDGRCPKCQNQKWEKAHLTPFEYVRFFIRITRGK